MGGERESQRESERERDSSSLQGVQIGGRHQVKRKKRGGGKRYRGGLEGVHVGGGYQIVPAAGDEEYRCLYCADPVDRFPPYIGFGFSLVFRHGLGASIELMRCRYINIHTYIHTCTHAHLALEGRDQRRMKTWEEKNEENWKKIKCQKKGGQEVPMRSTRLLRGATSGRTTSTMSGIEVKVFSFL
jgi:hypothetical protein